ncbi:hypothetical protein ACFS5N_17035 [Mucilaginibacter ximonensis]|uniref:Uncharacterized protein n=1 Tax=Mucilaginibacter ximonensis TaxID=538021 RepID=A0ABW5YH08_9SPHI
MSKQTHGNNNEAGMVWWPYIKYELVSKLSPEQIRQKIELSGEEDFVIHYLNGIIYIKESSSFKFGSHSRSFKPEAALIGASAGDAYKYRVELNARLSSMLLLGLVLLAIVATIAFSKRNDLIIGHYKDAVIACICVLMMGYALPVVTFNADLNRIKLFIDDLLEIEP